MATAVPSRESSGRQSREGEVRLAPPTVFQEQDAAVGNKNEEQNEMYEKIGSMSTRIRTLGSNTADEASERCGRM